MKSIVRRELLRVAAGHLATAVSAAGVVSPLSAFAQSSTSRPGRASTSSTAATRSFGSGPTRVALLLETQSQAFGRAAAAVIEGVRSAHSRDGQGVAVDIFSVSDSGEDVAAVLASLPNRGYGFVIGPLTRNSVNALADVGSLPIPVLALNLADPDRRPSRNLIFFGLAIEVEGRQVARAAFDEASIRVPNRRPLTAVVINNSTPIGRRSFTAFSDTWRQLGGAIVEPVETDSRVASEIRAAIGNQAADAVFAAVGPDALRAVRASLPKEMPLWATSQANSLLPGVNLKAPELDGVRLVGMPWQLQPDHAAVMAYPKAPGLTHLDFQRLYALGIDAFRLSRELLSNKQRFELDGVTGRLRVDLQADARIDRISVVAEYRNGVIVPIEPR